MRCLILIVLSMASLSASENDTLIKALKIVESNNNTKAVGDNGRSIGILQIQRACFEDAKAVCDELDGYKYEDCYKEHVSELVFRAYIKRYATEKRIGRKVTDEDKARIWNGGPNGYKKECTLKYWEKVKAVMK